MWVAPAGKKLTAECIPHRYVLPSARMKALSIPDRHTVSQPTDLNKFRKQRRQQKAKGKTLCNSGFHKWEFDGAKQFDVKQGKLVSIERCQRCGATRNHIS